MLEVVKVDALAGMMTDTIIDVVSDIGIDVLVGANVNVFAVAMPAPSEEFSCWAVFDCRPMALLNCDRVLQARKPSCHV